MKILNPVPGGQDTTSLAHARRYVRQGRARVVDPQHTIEFIDADHRHVSAAAGRASGVLGQAFTVPTLSPYVYEGPDNLRTFLRYPDDAETAFAKKAA